MAPPAQSPVFVYLSVPNRSLGARGRRWVVGAIAAATLGIGAGASAIGAWPVLPFAGLEVALVWLAFRVVSRHDADFERLEIGEHEVRFEARSASHETRLVATRAWARLVQRERNGRLALGLLYAGRTVALGRLLSDEGRRSLARELRGRLAVAAN